MRRHFIFFFFNDTATTEIYTLSLHDALPISSLPRIDSRRDHPRRLLPLPLRPSGLPASSPSGGAVPDDEPDHRHRRSEEHTSELQSRQYLVCRLLLEKKKKIPRILHPSIYLC